ncbi:hypothetical protein NHH73_04810 [Oxalobacteraceae bacterium OTU3CINTB1]|nr:hypothetical protein NHH73_04810 [Oxalobacteraceae bacterium OTU3CINTB1]
MFTTVAAQLSTPTLLRLIEYLRMRSDSHDVSEALNIALEFWLDSKNELPPNADRIGIRGYQWKTLFLPEGTILRSWSYGEHNYARVEGDKIIHDGQSVSPNQFARHFARTARNAWFDLSVRRPGDKQYKMAGLLREELAQENMNRDLASTAKPNIPEYAPTALPPDAPAANPTRTVPVKKEDFDPGWDLPERRKFRYRVEDTAY